jgi:hypothetical protein
MSCELKVGQHWQEVDPRLEPPVREIVSVGESYERPRRGGGVMTTFQVTFKSLANGRKTVARAHLDTGVSRFNGKRGGYKLVKDVA